MAISSYVPSEAIEQLRAVVRAFLDSRAPVERTLELMEQPDGYDRAVWRQMADQMGLPGIAVPERYGGQGFGFAEAAVVLEELGRVVYMGPFLATLLASEALLLAGDEDACAALLPALAAGERTGTLALFEPERGWALETLETEALRDGAAWRLSGAKAWVLDGADADVIVVSARSAEGVGLYAVERPDASVVADEVPVLDLTRPLATLRFERTPARRLGDGDAIPALVRCARAAIACEQVGALRACLEMTVAYARERLQFGRPIGSYQAVRHRCADMLVLAETARAVGAEAASAIARDGADQEAAVGIAKAYCSDAFLRVADDAIQLHGGIGFTWEHPAHVYFKRAKASALLFGDPAQTRREIAGALVEGPSADSGTPVPAVALDPDDQQATLALERTRELLRHYDAQRGPDAEFWGRQFDLGLAWVQHPVGEGGLGIDPAYQAAVDSELAAAGVPDCPWRSGIGLALVVLPLATFGSPEQKRRYLRPLFTGEEVWCQLFSEPGAGSDLAGLSTRAVKQADGSWLVNGQKVWTSLAHRARWGIMCARTDPSLPKHAGLTYFIVDMVAPGVEVRPLRQITGEAEFSEVYLTDLVVPESRRVGAEGSGWEVTLTTLASERFAFNHGFARRGEGPIAEVLALWRAHGSQHEHLGDQVLDLAVQAEAVRLAARAAVNGAAATAPLLKLAATELDKRIVDLAVTQLGSRGLTYDDYTMTIPESIKGLDTADVRRAFLFARSMTIAGGTSEIQRTVIADRLLKLPREPQPDRDRPWRDVPRN